MHISNICITFVENNNDMRYQGSKARIIKPIKHIIENVCPKDYTFVDMFMGGANVICDINIENKIGNDINTFVYHLWNDVKKGTFIAPSELSKQQYYSMKLDAIKWGGKRYKKSLLGYVSTSCSFGGSPWNGYASFNPKKNENHILEAYNSFNKQVSNFINLDTTTFTNKSYNDLIIPNKSFIYCDPPYRNTKGYKVDFDFNQFDNWIRQEVNNGKIFLISEYSMPNDFICIWSKTLQDGMNKGVVGKTKCEKLFVHKSQAYLFKGVTI